jgi:prolyl oligopeptidase
MIFALALVLATGAGCEPGPSPPETPVRVVVDTLHGEPIPDPYRWLEDRFDPEVRRWIEAQNAYTEAVIGDGPLRNRLQDRLRELMDTPDVGSPRRAGDYEYFTLRRQGGELPVIYRRPAPEDEPEEQDLPRRPPDPDGEYEVVADPHGRSPGNTTRFDILDISPDHRFMLYSERDGGADEIVVRVRDLEENRDLPDTLPWALYGSIFFDDEGEGFYYVHRSREVGPRLRYRALGAGSMEDPVLFGEGYGPESFLRVSSIADGRYFLLDVGHGWARSELHLLARDPGLVLTVVKGEDARFYPRFHEGTLFVRTDLDAFRNRLLAVALSQLQAGEPPAPGEWREVIPESDELVMHDVTILDGRLYVTYLDPEVNHRIHVFDLDGTPVGELEIPEYHSASLRGAGPGRAFLTLSSFTEPSTTWLVDLETGERSPWEVSEVPWDGAPYSVFQVWHTSADGTRVPMWIVHHRALEPDGDAPVLLSGYGGFYVARTPGFNSVAAAWLEMGGVYAVATLRGGSEFGEGWHRDGMLERKQNVVDDFISAAEWLVENGYTRPGRLGIQGASNGGLLVAAALTQRPDLFGAVLCAFPDVDILRFPWYVENKNAPALLEYGDARIPSHFQAIRRYSPYQNVEDRVAYPAVLFTMGDLDTRVPPQGALKMTARLQAASASDRPVLLRYHEKAGHSAGRGLSFSRRVEDTALELTFLVQELGVSPPPEPGTDAPFPSP